MKFYYDAAKVTEFTTGVTFYGTAGTDGYSQIVVSDTTPHILYYQFHILIFERSLLL